jgi:hypothetical protein
MAMKKFGLVLVVQIMMRIQVFKVRENIKFKLFSIIYYSQEKIP